MAYFVIHVTDDGDILVDQLTEESLLERINSGWYGSESGFLASIPMTDPNYWEAPISLIIKGEIVVPKPKSVVVEYGL